MTCGVLEDLGVDGLGGHAPTSAQLAVLLGAHGNPSSYSSNNQGINNRFSKMENPTQKKEKPLFN